VKKLPKSWFQEWLQAVTTARRCYLRPKDIDAWTFFFEWAIELKRAYAEQRGKKLFSLTASTTSKKDRFVIVLPLVMGGTVERYYQRAARCGRPVGTLNPRLAMKWGSRPEADRFHETLRQNRRWRTSYVDNA